MEERKATANKGFRLLQTQTGGFGSRQWLESRNEEEIPSLEMKGGVHLRQCAKKLRALALGSEYKSGFHLLLSVGSQAHYLILASLQE